MDASGLEWTAGEGCVSPVPLRCTWGYHGFRLSEALAWGLRLPRSASLHLGLLMVSPLRGSVLEGCATPGSASLHLGYSWFRLSGGSDSRAAPPRFRFAAPGVLMVSAASLHLGLLIGFASPRLWLGGCVSPGSASLHLGLLMCSPLRGSDSRAAPPRFRFAAPGVTHWFSPLRGSDSRAAPPQVPLRCTWGYHGFASPRLWLGGCVSPGSASLHWGTHGFASPRLLPLRGWFLRRPLKKICVICVILRIKQKFPRPFVSMAARLPLYCHELCVADCRTGRASFTLYIPIVCHSGRLAQLVRAPLTPWLSAVRVRHRPPLS